MDEIKMEELKIAFAHYESTNQIQKADLHKRNKYFLFLLLAVSMLLFNIVYDKEFKSVIDLVVLKLTSGQGYINPGIVNSLILTFILWLSLLYFKSIITVDRGFRYIRKLEDSLNNLSNYIKIDREGAFYKDNRLNFSRRVGFIYKYVFPGLIGIISLFACIISLLNGVSIFSILEAVLAILIIYVVASFVFRK